MSIYIGVDPGRTGAAVAINEAGKLEGVCPASWDRGSLSDDVHEWLDHYRPAVDGVGLEEPIVHFGGDRAKGIANSARAVALSAGQWIGMLAAVGLRGVKQVRPQTWQARILGKFPRGESKAAACRWASMAHGARMEGAIILHGDGVADAAALAEWIRMEVKTDRLKDGAAMAPVRRA